MARAINKYILFLVASIIMASTFFVYALDNDFKEKRSTHFIVYYKGNVDINFVNDIVDSAEGYYNQIADNLGFKRYNFWLWDNRAKIYIYPDKATYQSATSQPDWSGGCASYRDKTLWTYPHAVGFFDSVLPHELGHIIFREFIGSGRDIPIWLEEGVASYQEKSKRYAADSMVKDYQSKSKLMTMKQLNETGPDYSILDDKSAEVFYVESVSIVNYLISTFGKDRFAMLCQRLNEKETLDNALNMTYFNIKNQEELYKQWLKYLDKK